MARYLLITQTGQRTGVTNMAGLKSGQGLPPNPRDAEIVWRREMGEMSHDRGAQLGAVSCDYIPILPCDPDEAYACCADALMSCMIDAML